MHKKTFYFFFLLIFLNLSAQAQLRKWTVGFNFAALDFVLPYAEVPKPFDSRNWNEGVGTMIGYKPFPLLNVSLGYYITNLNKLSSSGPSENLSNFLVLNGELHPIHEKWYDPYLALGGGLHILDNVSYGSLGAGVGANIWFTEGSSLFVQGQYHGMPITSEVNNFAGGKGSRVYWQYTGGLKFSISQALDADKDGIADKKDKCPDDPGLPEFEGCPDTDGDKIIDREDKCPNTFGLSEFQGCPDTDGDKIPDPEDECPNQPGLASFNGCADTDGDGIKDTVDACPAEKGLLKFQGCPDTDGDDIKDIDDTCPLQKGLPEFQGCPDRDGDQIPDHVDDCPDQPGAIEQKGCPTNKVTASQLETVEKQLQMAAKEIQFESGKAVIRKESFDDLDQIAEIMLTYPESKFRVEGHTDNVGNAQSNKTLSQRRAQAVKQYFVKNKKIDAARIIAQGFGAERPKENNNTPEGRTMNRRVEIHVADE